jgi:aspartyl protease family protein
MSTFTVTATVLNPEHRERAMEVDFLVDTGATYIVLPPDVVDRLGLETRMERRMMLASGELGVWGLGDVRLRLDGEEHPTTFLAGPRGCRALFGAFGLELFWLAVDPVHHRLTPAPPGLL